MASGAVQSAVYAMGYETGDSVQKLDAARGSAEKLVRTTDGLAASEEKVSKATRTSADQMEKLLARLDPRIRAEQRLQAVREQVNRAEQAGIGTSAQYARAIELAQQKVDRLTPANDNFVGSLSRMGQGLSSVNRLLGAFGVTISGMALVGFSRGVFEIASGLDEIAQQVGVSTEALQAYRAEMGQSGIAQADADKILQRLTRTIGEATAAAGSQRDAFVKLGLTAEDLAGGTEAALPKIAAALLKIDDASERAALEADLFGKTGQKLESALRALIDPSSTLIEKWRAMGHILSNDVTKSADEAADGLGRAWDRAQKSAAPSITNIIVKLGELLEMGNRVNEWFKNSWISAPYFGLTGYGSQAEFERANAPKPSPGIPSLDGLGKNGVLINGRVQQGGGYSSQNQDTVLARLREQAAMAGKSATEQAKIVALREAEAAKIKDGNGLLTATEKLDVTRLAILGAQDKAAKEAAAEAKKFISYRRELLPMDKEIAAAAEKTSAEGVRQLQQAEEQNASVEQYIYSLQEQVRLAGLTADEREREEAKIQAIRLGQKGLTEEQERTINAAITQRQATEKWREVVEQLTGGFQNFFRDLFTNGKDAFGNLWSYVKNTFAELLAYMATQALVKPIIIPMVQSIFASTGLGSVLGMGSMSGGGLFGGGSSPFGLLSSGSSVWDMLSGENGVGWLGGFGGGFAGVPSSLLSFGGGGYGAALGSSGFGGLSGLFGSGTGLFGSGTSALTFGGQAANASSIFNFTGGSGLFSGGLGGVLGGFGIGSLLGGMMGGNSLVSGGLGAIGGLVGGPIGMLAGGAIGGLLGNFGASNQGAISNFTNDGLGNTLFKAGGGNNGALATQATGSINATIKALRDAGISVGPGNISGISVGSDKSYVYDFAGGKQKLAGGEAGVQATVDAVLARILPGASANTPEAQAIMSRYGSLNSGNIQQVLSDLAQAKQLADAIANLSFGDDNLSEAERAIKAINAQIDPLVEQAQALGIATDKLEGIRSQAIATVRAQEAQRQALQELADSYKDFGGTIDDLAKQANNAGQVAQRAADLWGSARDSLNEASRALLISDQSLSPEALYRNSGAEFTRLRGLVMGGDAAAAGDLSNFASQYLQTSFAYNGSTAAYGADLAYVRNVLGEAASYSSSQQSVAQVQADAAVKAVTLLQSIVNAIQDQTDTSSDELAQLREQMSEVKEQLKQANLQARTS